MVTKYFSTDEGEVPIGGTKRQMELLTSLKANREKPLVTRTVYEPKGTTYKEAVEHMKKVQKK